MKPTLKLLFLTGLVYLCAITTTYAQTTYVPDDAFEQALIDFGYDSGPLDDYVPTANINTLTYLNVGSRIISDLTGIEDFIALTTLECSLNHLTSLDLSENTALTYLGCTDNQLTSINLTQNTVLITLKVGFNQLTTLDVSQNTALDYLECNVNQLTSLNVSQNTALTTLVCINGQLTSLDLTQNTALTTLNLNDNQLTTLDLSQNTAITTLGLNKNQLTSLDVSLNTDLAFLFCKDNHFASLNVKNGRNMYMNGFDSSNNPNLICIEVDDAAWSAANWINIDPVSTFVNNQAECDALSETEYEQVSFSIYPNPTESHITIQTSSATELQGLSIFNIMGQDVSMDTNVISQESTQAVIDLSSLASGVYFVKSETATNKVFKN